MLVERGRLMPLTAVDAETGEVLGGGTLHHLDAERGIVEIGYWLSLHARGRGAARTIARMPDGRRVDKTLFSLLPGE
jgi:RimJ/RimL family protein N-acetyltransferase